MKMGYPSAKQEMEMLARTSEGHPIEEITSVLNREELVMLQEDVDRVYVDRTVNRYIVDLVTGTRSHEGVYLGVSPRGSIALMRAAKAYAFIHDRDYVIPDDIQYLAPYVLSHRMILTSEAQFEGASAESIIDQLLTATSIPVNRNVGE